MIIPEVGLVGAVGRLCGLHLTLLLDFSLLAPTSW